MNQAEHDSENQVKRLNARILTSGPAATATTREGSSLSRTINLKSSGDLKWLRNHLIWAISEGRVVAIRQPD